MAYQRLKDLINPFEGQLRLRESDFPDSEIGKLLQAFFDEAQLELTAAVASADDHAEEVVLEGALSNAFLGIIALEGQLQLSATFSVLDGEERGVIRLSFDNDWQLSQALRESAIAALANSLTSAVRNRFSFAITSFVLDSSFFSLSIGIEPHLAMDLGEVPQYLQGLSIESQFPTSGFPSFSTGLSLNAFEIGARIDPLVLNYLSAEIGLVGNFSWQPVGDLISFRDLKAEIFLVNPLDLPAANITISTVAEVSGTDIVGLIGLPNLDFQCYLVEGETIDIISLIEDIVDVPIPLPDLVCTSFLISGEPRNFRYEFFATVETNWDVLPNLTLTGITGEFTLVTNPTRSTYGGFSGSISFGASRFLVFAENQEGVTGWQFVGGIEEGTTLAVGEFIDTLLDEFGIAGGAAIDQVKDILGGITISQLDTSFHTQTKDFSFALSMQFSLDDDDKPSDLLLTIDLRNTTVGHDMSFGGFFMVGSREFSLSFDSTTSGANSTKSLLAAYTNPEGEEIDLITGIVNEVSGSSPLAFPESDADFNLTTLVLYELQLTYDKQTKDDVTTTKYGIKGDFGWQPKFNLTGNSPESFDVRAQIDLSKESGKDKKVLGSICGEIQNTIEGLEFLSLGACYEKALTDPNLPTSVTSHLTLQLTIGQITFNATYTKKAGDIYLEFDADVIEGSSLTLGEVVTFMTSLVDPSIDSFEFDPPWDFITQFDLSKLLESLTLTVDLTHDPKTKVIGFEITNLGGLVPSALEPLLTVNSLVLQYESKPKTNAPTKFEKKTKIILKGRFLGEETDDLSWDPINEAPPEIPGQGGSVFELRYLGLGQHVAFTQAGQVTSIKEVMDLLKGAIEDREAALQDDRALALRNPLETFGDGGAISFSPESEWLIGLDVSLLKTLNLTIIFNDPVIYGLRIELYGELAKNFAGLQFEILYQRITDTIGKYHVDLTLPDAVRYFQIGAVSVTMPLIVVDIFTNGDFKVDLGFPWDFNFSRSFALELFPFTGAGGFYFNKLSAATATLTPTLQSGQILKPADKGVFTPVYEFGLGLRVGLGKSFKSGPLNAEIQITVQGLITGVISWYNPIEPAGDRELYYKIGGGVAIVGRLYGEVDFVIISVSVEVIARAMILFLVEVYQPIQILLAAEVSVKASVKVAFIRVKFSFSLTVRQDFTLPSPQGNALPPWVQ